MHIKTNKTIREVERMVACGLDETEVAYCMDMSVVTLREEYKEQLEFGTAKVVAQVGGAMIKSAMRGDSNAAQFILRARARWVTPTKIEQDVQVTIEDKRKKIDSIVQLVHNARRPPVTIEQTATLEAAKKPAGGRAN